MVEVAKMGSNVIEDVVRKLSVPETGKEATLSNPWVDYPLSCVVL